MIGKKISTIILGAIVLIPLFIHSTGYAASTQAAVKEEESEALSITSPYYIPGSREKLFSAPGVDQIKFIPSMAIKEAYNDNIYMTTSDRKDDWISTISPGLEFTSKTERMNASLAARLNGIYYIDQHDLNAIDQSYQGKLRYALTEKLGLGGEAGFVRDSQSTREIDTTGIIFPTAVIRERQNYGITGDWRINETISTGISYKYGKDRYDRLPYVDQESQIVGLNFTTYLNELTQGRLNFGYANYRQVGSSVTTIDNYSGTIGISRDFSKIWSVLIDVGAVYTHNRFDVLTMEQTNNDWGPMGQISIACKYEKTSGSLTFNKSVMPVSGTAGAANRTSLGLNVSHKFTYELSGYLTTTYFINKSDPGQFSSTGIDQNTMQVSVGPRYDFNKDIYLTASYTYSRVDYGQTKTYADQHLAMLTLNIQHKFFE